MQEQAIQEALHDIKTVYHLLRSFDSVKSINELQGKIKVLQSEKSELSLRLNTLNEELEKARDKSKSLKVI